MLQPCCRQNYSHIMHGGETLHVVLVGLGLLQVNMAAVEHFIGVVGEKEDAIFQRRMRMLQRDKQRRERDKVRHPIRAPISCWPGTLASCRNLFAFPLT